jgi:hypothetical protein
MESRPPPITDSPWFWLLLFGSVALVMLTAVEPKFARRQERLERMQQSRQLGRAIEPGAGGGSAPAETPLWRPTHRANLRPLMLFLAAALAGGIILMHLRRRMAAPHAIDETGQEGRRR